MQEHFPEIVYTFGDFGNKLGQKETKQEKSLQFAELDKEGHRNASESKQENRGAQKLYCTHTLKRGKYQY